MSNINMTKPNVILIHGIWMTPLFLLPFGNRLKKEGFRVHYFNYNSLLTPPAKAAIALHKKISAIDANNLHFVAHSLGGLVIMHLFEQFQDIPPGRVVMLGSPVKGSQLALMLADSFILRPFVGRAMERALSGEEIPNWPENREWAMLSGTKTMGVGTIFGGLKEPNDGTVVVEETQHPAQKLNLTLPFSHTGLLYTPTTPPLTAEFLRTGEIK